MMYDREKSDPAIVAVKLTNKAGQPALESVQPLPVVPRHKAGTNAGINYCKWLGTALRNRVQAGPRYPKHIIRTGA